MDVLLLLLLLMVVVMGDSSAYFAVDGSHLFVYGSNTMIRYIYAEPLLLMIL